MHLRLGSRRGGRCLTSGARRLRSTLPPLLVIALQAGVVGAGCRRDPPPGVRIESAITPWPPVTGRAAITLRVLDASGAGVSGATLRIDAQMSHPGMAGVVARAEERTAGVYQADVRFTMPGDWTLLVSGSLPGGKTIRHQIDVRGVR